MCTFTTKCMYININDFTYNIPKRPEGLTSHTESIVSLELAVKKKKKEEKSLKLEFMTELIKFSQSSWQLSDFHSPQTDDS